VNPDVGRSSRSLAARRFAILMHRWLGVALCSLFLVWFPSGLALMYWEFPSVTPRDRLDRAAALDPSTIRLSPPDAFRQAGVAEPPIEARLAVFDGHPVYRFRTNREESAVYADTGGRPGAPSTEQTARVAAAWTGQPVRAATVAEIDIDQWTVEGSFRSLRPLWKYSWPDGEQVYVSQRTGEVVQYTTRASRIGAYVGAIPHWLYFTPLRRHRSVWTALVIGLAAAGTIVAVLGLVIGISVYSPRKRYRRAGAPSANPYRPPKRWHLALGLLFGAGAATWAFSGLMSMDPFSTSNARERVPESLQGQLDLPAFAARHPREALVQLAGADVKELECLSIAGSAVYLASLGGGGFRIVPMNGEPRAEFDQNAIAAALAGLPQPAGAADLRRVAQYDRYYLDRHRRLPLPVVVARWHDARATRYYIDPRTARIVGSYSSHDWSDRWLYHGLHSLDVPWLYSSRPSWDIVVLAFMIGGTALSVTSLLLAWRVVRRMTRSGPLEQEIG
jgi:hypothetical protein